MLTRNLRYALGGLAISCAVCALVLAQDTKTPTPGKYDRIILTRSPELKVGKVDHDRLAVRRLDIVDEKGTIRMTLGAPVPEPIVDGIQYKRIYPASGLLVFDKDGSERGGYVVADIEGSAVANVQDHANGDAIGWKIMPDGSVTFQINQRAPIKREAELGGRIAPDNPGAATRVKLSVAANGTPSIDLADQQSRPRLRLTVTEQGYGSIEFLNAEGRVVDSITPELVATDKSKQRSR